MHTCPSKGRLLKLKDEIGIVPYHDYCLHCDSYRAAAENAGLRYIYNFNGVDRASCSMLIYDPDIFDGRIIIDEDTEIMDRNASDNEYFHKDFHSSMNMGIEYLGSRYGLEEVREYLYRYTENVYNSTLEDIKLHGLDAIADRIRDTYINEKASDAVEVSVTNDALRVKVKYCPAVKHLCATGRDVSKWYRYTTEMVMERLAQAGDYRFDMSYYDEQTGAAEYSFRK